MNVRRSLLPLSGAVLAAFSAHAQDIAPNSGSSPYYLDAGVTFTHLSNVFNSPDGGPITSDNLTSGVLRGGFDQRISRQRLYGNASVSSNHYRDTDGLNNTSYGLNLGADWETVGHLSGTLVANSSRNLANFNPGVLAASTEKNLQRSDELGATARWGLQSALSILGTINHRKVTYSAAQYASQEYTQNGGSLGLSYAVGGALTLGTGVAVQNTDYPNFFFDPATQTFSGDQSKRRDVYFTANWRPSGASTLDARINVGKIDYDRSTTSDFSGTTGLISWNWQPTGLLTFITTASRDTGQQTGFPQLVEGNLVGTTNLSSITDAIRVQTRYQLSGKVVLGLAAAWAHRDLVDPATGGKVSDRTRNAQLSATWTPTRATSLSCQVGREARSAPAGTVLTNSYSSNTYGCTGLLTLR